MNNNTFYCIIFLFDYYERIMYIVEKKSRIGFGNNEINF